MDCSNCGLRFEGTPLCPRCGTTAGSDWQQGAVGVTLPEQQQGAYNYPMPGPNPFARRRRSKALWLVPLLVGVVAIGVVLGFLLWPEEPARPGGPTLDQTQAANTFTVYEGMYVEGIGTITDVTVRTFDRESAAEALKEFREQRGVGADEEPLMIALVTFRGDHDRFYACTFFEDADAAYESIRARSEATSTETDEDLPQFTVVPEFEDNSVWHGWNSQKRWTLIIHGNARCPVDSRSDAIVRPFHDFVIEAIERAAQTDEEDPSPTG